MAKAKDKQRKHTAVDQTLSRREPAEDTDTASSSSQEEGPAHLSTSPPWVKGLRETLAGFVRGKGTDEPLAPKIGAGSGWQLLDLNTGVPMRVGEVRGTREGPRLELVGGTPPAAPGSQGLVRVVPANGPRHERTIYPSTLALRWEEGEDA